MAASQVTLSKVVALLMRAGEKRCFVTPPLDVCGPFLWINVNAEPVKDGVAEGRGQPVRRDKGPDLSWVKWTTEKRSKENEMTLTFVNHFIFCNASWPHPPANNLLPSSPRPLPPPRLRGSLGTDWSRSSIMLSRQRPPICPTIDLYFSMNVDGMDRQSAARHSSLRPMERRYCIT